MIQQVVIKLKKMDCPKSAIISMVLASVHIFVKSPSSLLRDKRLIQIANNFLGSFTINRTSSSLGSGFWASVVSLFAPNSNAEKTI